MIGKKTNPFVFLKSIICNNTLILKNYVALTFLQVINAFFYIVIFPVVVPKIGVDGYGLFIYVTAVLSFFSVLINFGFDLPGLKKISISKPNEDCNSIFFSSVLIAKLFICFLCAFLLLSIFIFEVKGAYLYWACFLGVSSNVFLFNWFFQGVQKVSVLAGIQASLKVLALLLIVLFVKESDDLLLFALIINGLNFIASILSFVYIIKKFGIELKWPGFVTIKYTVLESMPFFWVNAITVAKYKSIEVIIGNFFGMSEVALYNLANKIYSIPSVLSTSINTSIFPKLARMRSEKVVKIVFVVEFLLAFCVLIGVIAFGDFAVDFLGKGLLPDAYPMLVLLSMNIFTFLIVGCYVYFIFVPLGKGHLVFENQMVALASFVISLIVLLITYWSVFSIIIALVISGLVEIVYCSYIVRKRKLFIGGVDEQ